MYLVLLPAGDLSNDGGNDLVAADRHGTLWFFVGNCRGGFARPAVVSENWRRFQALF